MSIAVNDKRVFVTGGARGIGAAIVRHLAAGGAEVASVDVTEDSGQEVARKADAAGPGTAAFRRTDVTDSTDVRAAVDWARQRLGGLDAVVNAAGVERRAAAEDLPDADLDLILDVNVKGLMYVCQAAFPALSEHGGSVINFGSDAGLAPYPDGAHYAASKGAVHAYTRTIAAEWGR